MKNTILANPTAIMTRPVIFGLMFALATFPGRVQAQSSVTEFVPFHDFLESTKNANSSDLARPGVRVKEAARFEEMRQHILTMYRGVEVTHSFVQNSSHFDCIPVGQQPSVRLLGLQSIAAAPPQSMLAKHADGPLAEVPTHLASQRDAAKPLDEFGNSVQCEANTIPMRRITLEEMTQFPTLREFFDKGPNGSGRAAGSSRVDAPAADPNAGHKYSYMQQNVDNLGGNSNINIWSPYVDKDSGEVFSLSQEWYVGGSGDSTQTAEVGWQNWPGKWGSQDSRLFIYWTADHYANTGCYNLECAGFVQVDGFGLLGGGFANYSTVGGDQYEFSAEYYMYQGNWWLAIDGTWIGYYPGSLYGSGQMASNAQIIQFGTESLAANGKWPAEGSGYMSGAGPSYAAYQRNLFYVSTTYDLFWDALTQEQPSPSCYTSSPQYSDNTSSDSGWTAYFYAGGPGGSVCE